LRACRCKGNAGGVRETNAFVRKTARAARIVHDEGGHRERLRRRLPGGGPEALADYEVLEYLLLTENAATNDEVVWRVQFEEEQLAGLERPKLRAAAGQPEIDFVM
jgi:hypothetical protein